MDNLFLEIKKSWKNYSCKILKNCVRFVENSIDNIKWAKISKLFSQS
jgi:hypothetical protein